MAVSRRAAMTLTSENIPIPSGGIEPRQPDHNQTSNPAFLKTPLHTLIDLATEKVEKYVEPDEYEDLPTQSSWVHGAAGSLAGIAEHCVMYPVDLVKTRRMAISNGGQYSGVIPSIRSIAATEGWGFRGLCRGMPVVLTCAGPAHGAYFATYEAIKRCFGKTNPWGHMIAGAAASLVHDGIMTPVDAVKQRMQKYKSTYPSSRQCAKSMYYQEGVLAFYRSYGTQIAMNMPQQCIHFVTYEKIKTILNPEDEYRPLVHIVSGGLAGGLAAAITTPFDVCKTLLNTQPTVPGNSKPAIIGIRNGMRTIYRVGGWSGFYKGWQPRVLTIAPSTAICWWVYESFKYLLC